LCCTVASSPPFVVRHHRFRIRSRSRIRLPVKFAPGATNPDRLSEAIYVSFHDNVCSPLGMLSVAKGPVKQYMQIETSGQEDKETLSVALSGVGC
jgi:hypothetical protein